MTEVLQRKHAIKEPVTTCDMSRKLILMDLVSCAGTAWKNSSGFVIS